MVEIAKRFTVSKNFHRLRQKVKRMTADADEIRDYKRKQDGINGELQFYKLAQLHCQNAIGMFDIILDVLNKEFQIDSLFIMQDEIYLFEIKWLNYDVEYRNHQYYFCDTGESVSTYMHQRNRTLELFSLFLRKYELNYKVHYYHIFMNEESSVYGITKQDPCIHINSLKRFLIQQSQVPLFEHHHEIISILKAHLKEESAYSKKISFDWYHMKKGVLCPCGHFINKLSNKRYSCQCGDIISSDEYIKRGIDEFILCFPEETLTVSKIYSWLDENISLRSIRNYFNKNMVKHSNYKSAHYTISAKLTD